MKLMRVLAVVLMLSSMAFGQLFINEIDYDNPGTDTGEFVEIAGPAGAYSGVTLEHYNGYGGTLIWSLDLPDFTLADEATGYGFYC